MRAAVDTPTATGVAVGLAGLGLVGVGLLARNDVRRTLTREHIVDDAGTVADATRARAMAELIRRNTIDATGGRTYAEIDAYLDAEGAPTPDAALAAIDERTRQPLENPDHDLWIQSTTLQTALMQAYVAFRLSELTIALGSSLAAVGIGLAAAGRRSARR